MNRDRLYAALLTLLLILLVSYWLMVGTVAPSRSDREWPPKHDSEIALVEEPEEEFVEVVETPVANSPAHSDPSPAETPKPEVHKSEPAPQSGHDLADKGKVADVQKTVTTPKSSPVKVKKEETVAKAGPTVDKEKQEQEDTRRKATAATKNAFQNAQGKNNTTANGKTDGDSGKPTGSSSAVNGSGTGQVGGGWAIPKYAKIPSTHTGSIKMQVKIDSSGKVTDVKVIGGDAPAATDSSLRSACIAEVRSKRFTRSDDNAPETTTAYITYTFK